MILTLLAWIYITFLCWAWGNILISLVNNVTNSKLQPLHFSFICLTGLSIITIVAGLVSLIIPLGTWWVQLFFLLPAIPFLLRKRETSIIALLKKRLTGLHVVSLLLLASMMLLILVMSSWKIVHPDTLGYHAQTIQWVEKYKVVPGLVHLHVRFGYQGLWFVDNALFSFSFAGLNGITFLNSTMLFWLLIFLVNRINHNLFSDGKRLFGLAWIIFLALGFWSYTQVRLTATSASPDFIATIFVLSILYILFKKNANNLSTQDWLLVSILSMVAVTIKLSVAPLLVFVLIATILLIKAGKLKMLLVLGVIGVFCFAGFITRNIITSGYVIFPSVVADVADVDWKYNKELTIGEKNYITAYAKKQGVSSKNEIDAVNKSSFLEWMPTWWQQRSVADKFIFGLLLLSLMVALVFLKRVTRSGLVPILAIVVMIAGIAFWFANAPDPRFGFGFILGFIFIVAYLAFHQIEIKINKKLSLLLLMVCTAVVLTYVDYRFKNFYEPRQWIKPLGIEKPVYASFDCDGIMINVPLNDDFFGNTPVPATDLRCDKFSPRGANIEDGFKAK